MKKWKKVLLIIVSIMVILTVSGAFVYKKYLEPKVTEKIDIVVEKAEEVMKDESFKATVDEVAQSMIDDGVIKLEDMPTYSQLKAENEEKREEQEAVYAQIQKPEKPTPTPKVTVAPTPTPTPEPTKAPLTKQTLKERLKAAMTADEFAFALSMYSRIDLGYARKLLSTDRATLKQYIYSKASSAEISKALEIYAKYSYLLN